MNYAGFWLRAAANLIDTIIMIPLILLPVYLIYGDAYFAYTEEIRLSHGFWIFFSTMLCRVCIRCFSGCVSAAHRGSCCWV